MAAGIRRQRLSTRDWAIKALLDEFAAACAQARGRAARGRQARLGPPRGRLGLAVPCSPSPALAAAAHPAPAPRRSSSSRRSPPARPPSCKTSPPTDRRATDCLGSAGLPCPLLRCAAGRAWRPPLSRVQAVTISAKARGSAERRWRWRVLAAAQHIMPSSCVQLAPGGPCVQNGIREASGPGGCLTPRRPLAWLAASSASCTRSGPPQSRAPAAGSGRGCVCFLKALLEEKRKRGGERERERERERGSQAEQGSQAGGRLTSFITACCLARNSWCFTTHRRSSSACRAQGRGRAAHPRADSACGDTAC